MRIFLVGVMIALLTLSANAQGMFGGGGGGGGGGRHHRGQKAEDAQKKPKRDERVQTPVTDTKPAGPIDPWRNVRDNDSSKTGKNPL